MLIQRLRDTERQLLATERPLESLAKLGQHGAEVQFFLRRTGPSSSTSDGSTGSERSLTLPRPSPTASTNDVDQPPKRREPPRKSLTFNLGPSSSPRAKAKDTTRKSLPSDSPEQRASPSPVPSSHTPSPPPLPTAATTSSGGPSKEEVFRHILQQQEALAALQAQLEGVERESHAWERSSPSPSPSMRSCGSVGSVCSSDSPPEQKGELQRLEETLERNQAELAHMDYWEEELRVELEHESSMRRRLAELHARLDDCGRRLLDFNERAQRLEHELQKESQGGVVVAMTNGNHNVNVNGNGSGSGGGVSPEESLGVVRVELQSQQRQGAELEAELSQTESTLGKTEALLQVSRVGRAQERGM